MSENEILDFTSMEELQISYLAGQPIAKVVPKEIFDEKVCVFLDELGRKLRQDTLAKSYPDIMSFAFYCRKSNILKLRENYVNSSLYIGRGLAFHIAPSNVPVNFAFSYLFGLISGCANVVRVSSKEFIQTNIICKALSSLFEKKEYQDIRNQTAIIRYGRDKVINDILSSACDVRVIWGGDATIHELRQSPIKPRCQEIVFADRFSIGIMDTTAVLDADGNEIRDLAKKFYNDTYLMDQNACSTPHLIFWLGGNSDESEKAKNKFWKAVYNTAARYDLDDIKVSDKYVLLCEYAATIPNLTVKRYDNLLYVMDVQELPDNISLLRGKFGMFFQHDLDSLSELSSYINARVQSCLFFGVEQSDILRMIKEYHMTGIDRIVPFGNSLDIGLIWDGYDIPRMMSRRIGVGYE